jgi:hypothetical protein
LCFRCSEETRLECVTAVAALTVVLDLPPLATIW